MKATCWRLFGAFVLISLLTLGLMACSSDDESPVDGDNDGDVDGDTDGDNDGDTDGDTDDEQSAGIEPHVEHQGLYTIVWLRGTPYEMGYQQGELMYDLIKEAMEFVDSDPILKSIPALAEGLGIIEMAENNSYQEVLDECQGLVDATEGTGFSMEYCLALNFGDVMLENLPAFKSRASDVGPGCSEIIAKGDATPDGRLYHGRNLDWGSMNIEIIHSNPVIFVRQPTGGIPHVYVGFPLNLSPYTGMNAAGLSICSNEIDPASENEQAETGHSHVQMQYMALSTLDSLDAVRDFYENETHMSAEVSVVADGNVGEASVFEMTASMVAERSLQNGIVYATNHFEHPDMVDRDLPQDTNNPDSSMMRWERLQQLIEPDGQDSVYGQLDIYGLAAVQRDRVNPRTGVAAPYDDSNVDNDAGMATNGPMHFVIFDPEKLLFWVAAGKDPDNGKPYVAQQDFTCFSLGELLGWDDAVACDPATIPYPNTAN